MNNQDWHKWGGLYSKLFYEARLLGAEIVSPCYPNAGVLFALDGTGRTFLPSDKIEVRTITTEEAMRTAKGMTL